MNSIKNTLKTSQGGVVFTIALITCCAYFLISTAKYADIDTAQKIDNHIIGPFDNSHSYYQTFIPSKSHLSNIEISFSTTGNKQKNNVHVYATLTDCNESVISAKKHKIPRSSEEFDMRLSFTPQHDSKNKTYCLALQTNAPPGIIFLTASRYDTYSNGELFTEDGFATNQDLAFFTYTKPYPVLEKGTGFQKSLSRFLYLLLISIVFLYIGYIIAARLSTKNQNIIELSTYSIAIGISLPIIILMALSLFKITLEIKVLAASGLGLLLIAIARESKHNRYSLLCFTQHIESREIIVLSTMLLIAFATRTIQISSLLVPSGVDGQFHQKIIERIVDRHMIPLNAIYHIGFHSNVFVVKELFNLDIPEATLIYGQWLSVISGLTFYILARKVFGKPTYALTSAALYWFITPIPAYFINISRYPFLQGLTLLPIGIALLWDSKSHHPVKNISIAMISIGLFLSHYGSAIIFIVLTASIFFYYLPTYRFWPLDFQAATKVAVFIIPLVVAVLIKLYYTINHGSWESFLNSETASYSANDYRYFIGHTLRHGGVFLWSFGILGSLLAILRHPRLLQTGGVYVSLFLLLRWMQLIFTGHSATSLTNELYALSIPLALLAGYFIKHLFKDNNRLNYFFLVTVILAGSYNISGIINPRNVFYSGADQIAMEWIKHNVKSRNVFLINSYPWDGKMSPTDGGYWINYFTGRTTIFNNNTDNFEELTANIQESNADYVYIGSGFGSITPIIMNQMENALVYNRRGVYIYNLHR